MRKKLFVLFIFIVAITSVLFLFYKVKGYHRTKAIREALKENIASLASSFDGNYAFLVKILDKEGVVLSYRADKKMPAASIIKVPIMAAVFYSVKAGRLSLGKLVTLTSKDITAGSGVLKRRKMPYTISIGKLLECMIAYSDNTATNKFISILGADYINMVFTELGLKDTVLRRRMMDFSLRKKGVDNYTSCRDVAYLLEKMYNGELVSPFYSQLMILLLKRQVINDRIPRYLPKEVTVAHKTGLEKTIVSDAGIVFSKDCSYIICVMVDKFKSYREAKDFIAKLSLVVYNTLKDYRG